MSRALRGAGSCSARILGRAPKLRAGRFARAPRRGQTPENTQIRIFRMPAEGHGSSAIGARLFRLKRLQNAACPEARP